MSPSLEKIINDNLETLGGESSRLTTAQILVAMNKIEANIKRQVEIFHAIQECKPKELDEKLKDMEGLGQGITATARMLRAGNK